MRVKGPGGTRGTAAAGGVKGSQKTGKVFKLGAAQAAEDSTEKARQVRSWLLEELTGLARDVKEGKTSKEDATRQFVHLVVKEKLNGKGGQAAQAMENSIADMCESDPQFAERLHKELSKMSRS